MTQPYPMLDTQSHVPSMLSLSQNLDRHVALCVWPTLLGQHMQLRHRQLSSPNAWFRSRFTDKPPTQNCYSPFDRVGLALPTRPSMLTSASAKNIWSAEEIARARRAQADVPATSPTMGGRNIFSRYLAMSHMI